MPIIVIHVKASSVDVRHHASFTVAINPNAAKFDITIQYSNNFT
jgi:hypothetical protein